jgi:tRNA U34 5-methylaminomethyl-2-thiouridine-forming methyltransferase MnmC
MDWTPQLTQDGSFTFFSEAFGEAFHSRQGAKSEAFAKFARVTDLVGRSQRGTIRLLDVCYGLGYNTAAAIETIWAANPQCKIECYGLELDHTVPIGATTSELLQIWPLEVQEILQELAQTHGSNRSFLSANLWIGDARSTVQALALTGFQADAIFFDPFSPRKCPQLWTVEFFRAVAACLAPGGVLATYSRSAAVRSAMGEAGLAIGSIPLGDFASSQVSSQAWSQGTVAVHWECGLTGELPRLSEMELEHLETRAGVPYRDPGLSGSMAEIVARHEQEQQGAGVRSTSSWRRKWGVGK